MNRYGAIAKSHWQEHLPARYQRLADPTGFFEQLGREAETEIETLYRALLANQPIELRGPHREAWRARARNDAEQQILAELIYLPPEDDDTDRTGPDSSMTAAMNELYDSTDPFGPTRD